MVVQNQVHIQYNGHCQVNTYLMHAASVSMKFENMVTVWRAGTRMVLIKYGLLVSNRDLSKWQKKSIFSDWPALIIPMYKSLHW
jgi:hypothetical protein